MQWYAQEVVSQGKAAELAGLSRVEFLEELPSAAFPPARSPPTSWRARSMASSRRVVPQPCRSLE
ncbi:UPF0175 family protein [Thiocapsa imhoffii]|uniref:UPF0175 family protein n=1 Tax=Thiocapsa imhoffii TaxID=382777 RepID=UPI0030B8751B